MGQIYSEGFMIREATKNPRKLIVLLGMWCLHLPGLLIGGWITLSSLFHLFTDSNFWGPGMTFTDVVLVTVALMMLGGLALFSFVSIYRTTKNYYRLQAEKANPQSHHEKTND
ncbi:MAG: hypothetical protein HUJ26_11205 [Planctomycetaceae bacterium]|nr:hypothetical protein [Planctomycetaceae bacterium]